VHLCYDFSCAVCCARFVDMSVVGLHTQHAMQHLQNRCVARNLVAVRRVVHVQHHNDVVHAKLQFRQRHGRSDSCCLSRAIEFVLRVRRRRRDEPSRLRFKDVQRQQRLHRRRSVRRAERNKLPSDANELLQLQRRLSSDANALQSRDLPCKLLRPNAALSKLLRRPGSMCKRSVSCMLARRVRR